MKFIRLIITFPLIFCGTIAFSQSPIRLTSPNGNIAIEVTLYEKIYYSVFFKGTRILEPSPMTITMVNAILGANPVLVAQSVRSTDNVIKTVWGSRSEIRDHYNQLTLDFQGSYSVEFRAYDQGVAYHFVTRLGDKQVTVVNEEVSFRFKFGLKAWMADSRSYETSYTFQSLDVKDLQSFKNNRDKIYLPIVVSPATGVKMLITEAGLYDYPSLFLDRGNDYENFFNGTFERVALSTKPGGFSNYSQLADKEAGYIAVASGSRDYPWRLMIISDNDSTFADCDLIYLLSKPCALKETAWIKPGKVAWEWWHDYAVEGQPFKGGVNTQTYLYHTDFAAKYGLEYILIDWQWTDKYDLTAFSPDIDLRKITSYATGKGIGVIVWCPSHTLHRQLEKALDLFSSYGVAGIKTDFFGREDQTGIKMYEDIAIAAAQRKMLVDFHGATKPTGLSRTYPNIINYEAVAGNEWNKLSEDKVTIAHKAILPFIRGPLGPMDFTPGGMRNIQAGHSLRFTLPEVHGTRCGEMALFVLYNEPLKMLCDAPSVYDREPALTRFIAQIPTVWDDTKVLEAKFGEYLLAARRKGEFWYLAGLNGEKAVEVVIDLPFLNEGYYTATMLKDGPNADRIGTDYCLEDIVLNSKTRLNIKMEKGGGFIICIRRQ